MKRVFLKRRKIHRKPCAGVIFIKKETQPILNVCLNFLFLRQKRCSQVRDMQLYKKETGTGVFL